MRASAELPNYPHPRAVVRYQYVCYRKFLKPSPKDENSDVMHELKGT